MEREACVCDHGFERSDLCAEIINNNNNNNNFHHPNNSRKHVRPRDSNFTVYQLRTYSCCFSMAHFPYLIR